MFELISPEAIGLIIGVVSVGYNWVQKHDMSMLEKNFKEVIAYFDPDDTGQATVPETVKTVPDIPGRAWQMSDQVKNYLLHDHSLSEREIILEQINEAEREKLAKYRINYAGGYYTIQYGQIAGVSKWS